MTLVSNLPCLSRGFREISLGSWNPPSAPLLSTDVQPANSTHLPPESAYFIACNRNKRSITVNFKAPEGIDILRKLIVKSDILVENFVSGKLAEIGLGWDTCRKLNEKLIYVSITGGWVLGCFTYHMQSMSDKSDLGYGQTGPYRTAAGYDVVIEGEAGLMHMYAR